MFIIAFKNKVGKLNYNNNYEQFLKLYDPTKS